MEVRAIQSLEDGKGKETDSPNTSGRNTALQHLDIAY